MTDSYNNRFQDEILSPAEPIYDIKKVSDNSIILEDIQLLLKNTIVQEGNFLNAAVMNNILGRINANSKNLASVMLIVNSMRRIQSSGTDNLEITGINDETDLFMKNNHSDFGILAANVSAGINQIKIINASGFRFNSSFDINVQSSNSFNQVSVKVGNFIALNKAVIDVINNALNRSIQWCYGKIGVNSILEGGISTDQTTTEKLNLINLLTNTNVQVFPIPRYVAIRIYDEEDKCAYALGFIYNQYNNAVMWKTNQISENQTSFTNTQIATLNGFGLNNNFSDYSNSAQAFYNIFPLKPKGVKAAYNFALDITQASTGWAVWSWDNNYTTFTKTSLAIRTTTQNQSHFKGFIKVSTNYIACIEGILYKFKSLANGKLDVSSPYEILTIPFLNGRTINNISLTDNVAFIYGTNSLLAYSLDGVNWTEIIMNNDSLKNTNYFTGIYVIEDNSIYVSTQHPTQSSRQQIFKYESFNPENFKNKKYVLNTEPVLINSVSLVANDIILGLNSSLLQNHTQGELLRRTNNSTIPPNSKVNVTVEIENLFSHNAVVLFPQFTNLQNVSIDAEISHRNNINELENFENIPLVHEIELNADWREQTYYLNFPNESSIFAASFTVTNNNEFAIELFQLIAILYDEIYDTGV